MNILGIETSCDETAASVVVDGQLVLSNVVSSQINLHAQYGGVIPEIAARSHLEIINPIINRALSEAKLGWDGIDTITIANGPGLIGSLLIGTLAARTLALTKNKPLIPLHHILGHFYANFLSDNQPKFPCLTLIISGGHTQLMWFDSPSQFIILGQTQDDAVGEAFDKVAKIIGLPYPGGPAISRLAESGDPNRFKFTKPKLNGKYDFSFSGLKTALLRTAQDLIGKDHTFPSHQIADLLSSHDKADLAASFQACAIDILLDKTALANDDLAPESICLAGGVSANQKLRHKFKNKFGARLFYPDLKYCTDNAAMVAAAGYFLSQTTPTIDPHEVEAYPQHRLF